MREEIERLLDAHDGDDRCGCLAASVRAALDGEPEQVRTLLRTCIAEHPAGLTYRNEMVGRIDHDRPS